MCCSRVLTIFESVFCIPQCFFAVFPFRDIEIQRPFDSFLRLFGVACWTGELWHEENEAQHR